MLLLDELEGKAAEDFLSAVGLGQIRDSQKRSGHDWCIIRSDRNGAAYADWQVYLPANRAMRRITIRLCTYTMEDASVLWPLTTTRSERGDMVIGGCSVTDLAEQFGTPLYIFDEATLHDRAERVVRAFADRNPDAKVVYGGKAYLSPAIIQILHGHGVGLDVVSGGVIELDNEDEISRLDQIAGQVNASRNESGTKVPVMLRLNPGVDVHTHAKISTGIVDSKFGFPVWEDNARNAV